ncbi:hypothetical protein [Niveispirillum sp. KHB5.9]|uniref:hypothetical protein n=1 Tax=Niveispirillum sp. KHB5.9 TaxID=3400269 RepID=UPI003A87B15B
MFACTRVPMLSLVLLALAWPAAAQQQQTKPETMDEVIVTAPRNGEPDFQEAQEFHQKEYQRLHAMFGKEPPAPPRGDNVFGMASMAGPNDRSTAGVREQIQGATPLRETFAGN